MDTPLFLTPSFPAAPRGPRAASLSTRRPPARRTASRRAPLMAAGGDGGGDAAASWRDDLRMLLDPSLTLGARTVLLQDLAKRGPEASKEAFEDVCGRVGLEGLPEVVTQVTEDVLPDLVQNGGRYAGDLGRRMPDMAASAAEGLRSGGGGGVGGVGGGKGPGKPDEVLAAVGTELRNVFNRTPEGVETPAFDVVRAAGGYELRRYATLQVAEAAMSAAGDGEVDAAGAMGDAFSTLAKYLFGANSSGGALAMTTPVVVDYADGAAAGSRMSFVLPPGESPAPSGAVADRVRVAEREGGVFAARGFSGLATAGAIARAKEALLGDLRRDGVDVVDDGCAVLIYNGPQTLVFLRKNEVLVRVEHAGDCGDEEGATTRSGEPVALNSNPVYDNIGEKTD